MKNEIISEFSIRLLKEYASRQMKKEIDRYEFEDYLLDNLYILTVLMNNNSKHDKSLRIDNYFNSFEHYFYMLNQEIFNGKCTKKKEYQPLAVAFYDQEATRVRRNCKNELVPHIHALFLLNPTIKKRFEKVFLQRQTYGVQNILEANLEKYYGGKGIEHVVSYSSKYMFSGKNYKNVSTFNIFPKHFRIQG